MAIDTLTQTNGASEAHPRVDKPVADDYMYKLKYNAPLPTVDRLGTDFNKADDPVAIAEKMVSDLGAAAAQHDADAFAGLFFEKGLFASSVSLPSLSRS